MWSERTSTGVTHVIPRGGKLGKMLGHCLHWGWGSLAALSKQMVCTTRVGVEEGRPWGRVAIGSGVVFSGKLLKLYRCKV